MYRWIRLDVGIFRHPKMIDLSNDGRVLYAVCLCHAQENKTDGLITQGAMRLALATANTTAETVQVLVDVGLLEAGPNGAYLIHDYLDYQPSAEEMETRSSQISQARSEAGRLGGLASASKRSKNKEILLAQNASKTEATFKHGNVHGNVNNNANNNVSMPLSASSTTPAAARAREPTTNADQPFEINGHDPVVLAVMQSFSLRLTEPGYRSMMSTLKSHQSLSKQWVAEAIACYGDYARRGEHINNAAALFDRWLTNVEIGRSPPTATRDSLEADKWARNAQDPVVIRHQQANEERKRKREEEKRATTERSGSGTEGEAGRGAPQNPRAP